MIADSNIREHIARLRAAAFNAYDLSTIPRYLMENTFLGGERFSFKDHEYQLDIISDLSRVLYVTKPAQVGLTEIQLRYALALARLIPYFSVIMTWPYAGDANNMVKTRLNPIITDSPDLRRLVDENLDNVEIKALGNSLIYARGTSGTTSALSVPADILIHDEVDRSDPHTLAQYQSRLKHSKYKMVRAFGTPTIEGVGISLMMETAKRKRHICKCNHCNHHFSPDYENDVHIPGYDNDKKEINKYNLHRIRWEEAVVLCPKCKLVPSLQPDRREWVVENTLDNFEAVGYFVTPFSAPNLVTPASLVRESTVYTTYGEFRNQALGLTSSENNDQLLLADVEKSAVEFPLDSSEIHCLGADMGLLCHITIGRLDPTGKLIVVHRERVTMSKFEKRRIELSQQYRVLTSVCDSYPYTDMIFRMQQYDKNLYGAIYHADSTLATYKIVEHDEKAKEGKLPIHQAKIHRTLNFDELMHMFKNGQVVWRKMGKDEDEMFVAHCLDMKRKQQMDKNYQVVYNWEKSTAGADHYMHSLGYLHVACRLMPTYSRSMPLPGLTVARRIKVASAQETDFFRRRA